MPPADRSISKIVLQSRPLDIPRNHLLLEKRAEGGGVAYLATELHTGD
jgi:hypothetical protein